MLTDFHIFFTFRLTSKFVVYVLLGQIAVLHLCSKKNLDHQTHGGNFVKS